MQKQFLKLFIYPAETPSTNEMYVYTDESGRRVPMKGKVAVDETYRLSSDGKWRKQIDSFIVVEK